MRNSFYSKINGLTFTRPGQEKKGIEIIPTLKKGQELKLVPEPENKFDPNAIAVYYENLHLGYIPKETAKSMKYEMERNDAMYICKISEITGGGDRNYGCNLEIIDTSKPEQEDEFNLI